MSSPVALRPPERRPPAADAARPAPRRRRLTRLESVRRLPARRLAAPAVGAAIAAVAFAADGGLRLERTTVVEIALMLTGAAVVALAVVLRPSGRLHGAAALAGVAALAAVTGLSILWAISPADAWEETNRTLAYLAVFAAGLALARLLPWSWEAVLGGIAIGCVAVCGWALLTKVLPGALAETELYARLRAPFDYWNAVGLMAALGVPPLLWLAARRSGHPPANALAWPGLGLLLTCLLLSYSRGALLALVAGVALWFVLVPLRLRGMVALAAAAAGAALPVAWAFTDDDLTSDRLAVGVRNDAGVELGLLLAVMVAGLLAAGLAVGYATSRRPPGERLRRIAARGALAALAAVALGGLVGLATAPGGIDGQMSKTWNQLTDPDAPTPANTPGRFTAASSVRARYWSEAFDVHAESPLLGTGAGGYATGRTRFRDGPLEVRHAHGYVPQTLADLGWLGLAVSLLAALAWLVAAARATGLRRGDRRQRFDPERVGVLTLAVVVVVFAVHSAVDWTWFVPGNAVVAMLAAGLVAGRPPLRERLAPAEAAAGADGEWRRARRRRRPWHRRARSWVRRHPLPAGLAAVVLAAALLASWFAYQPVRAVHAGDAALERLELGQLEAAESIARIAHDRNPLSAAPMWELAVVQDRRGDRTGALRSLEEAVAIESASTEAWRRLGRYQLTIGRPRDALRSFRAAYYLDPSSPEAVSDFLEVSRALDAQE